MCEEPRALRSIETPRDAPDKIVQVSGFGVQSAERDYMLVALTQSGTVLMSTGDGSWTNVGPKG